MNATPAFDNDKYIALQSSAIRERAQRFGNKLYLEIGGKLLRDLHASRVLPGFEPDVKLRMLQSLGDQIEFIVCAFAGDIEHRRYRADFGTTYDAEVLRLVDDVRARGLAVRSVVLTRFDPSMRAAAAFADRLRQSGLAVYLHSAIPGYPGDVDLILSDEGFGRNPCIETAAPIVGVIAPGPSSGKLATCLSQVWHENRRGVPAGYAKYETFPVWNLPLSHPVNVAYEAATADIEDFNQIDPFHLEAYGETTVNYNRDVAAFPILRALLTRLLPPDQVYRSPTDMGVNKVGFAIADDARVQEASRQEIVSRYLKGCADLAMGRATEAVVGRLRAIMAATGLKDTDRPVVAPAREAAAAGEAEGIPPPPLARRRHPQRREAPRRHSRAPRAAPEGDRAVGRRHEVRHPRPPQLQPQRRGAAHRALDLRQHEQHRRPRPPEAPRAARLRGPHDPHLLGLRRRGDAPPRPARHRRPALPHEVPLHRPLAPARHAPPPAPPPPRGLRAPRGGGVHP